MACLNFKDYSENFKKVYYSLYELLNGIVNLHDCGLDNYLKYLDYAKQLHEWGIHSPDCKIVVDAHDCGIEHENLIFVSTDAKMISKILENDPSFLSIMEFKTCS